MTTKARVQSALADYLDRKTYYKTGVNSMTVAKAQTSQIAVWKNQKADSPLRLFGNIQLTTDLLEQLNELEPNERGQVELKVALFRNESDSPKAPLLKGRVELPQDETDDEF